VNDEKSTVSDAPPTALYAALVLSVTRTSTTWAVSNHPSTSPWALVVKGLVTGEPPEAALYAVPVKAVVVPGWYTYTSAFWIA
jgi:hypothetical protein